MKSARARRSSRRAPLWSVGTTKAGLALAGLGLIACAAAPGPNTTMGVASEAEWRSLHQARPAPLDGATTVTVAEVSFLQPLEWSGPAAVALELGVAELAVAGLLRRRDVDFVERRRFSAAASAERRGEARRIGQPPAGVSRTAEFSASAVWLTMGAEYAVVDVRLTRVRTGDVATAVRLTAPRNGNPVAVARTIVTGVLRALDELGRRPAWTDPLSGPGGGPETNAARPSRVSDEAIERFFQGLAAEERWNWEGARRGYLAASAEDGFHEAATALARAARLRLGGTLAES